MEDKLTIEILMELIDKLDKQSITENFEIISHWMLPDQTIIKQGSKIYYNPKIKSGEVKVINIPENYIGFKPPELNIGYTDSNSMLEMHTSINTCYPPIH